MVKFKKCKTNLVFRHSRGNKLELGSVRTSLTLIESGNMKLSFLHFFAAKKNKKFQLFWRETSGFNFFSKNRCCVEPSWLEYQSSWLLPPSPRIVEFYQVFSILYFCFFSQFIVFFPFDLQFFVCLEEAEKTICRRLIVFFKFALDGR